MSRICPYDHHGLRLLETTPRQYRDESGAWHDVGIWYCPSCLRIHVYLEPSDGSGGGT